MANRSMKQPGEKPASGSPPTNTLLRDAWEKGRSARGEGKPVTTCPFGDYPGKQLRRLWIEGWESAAPPVVSTPAPPIRVQSPPIVAPGSMWPEGKALPAHYPRPRQPAVIPCPKCRALTTANGYSQAVILRATQGEIAYLWCRACSHQFRMTLAPK